MGVRWLIGVAVALAVVAPSGVVAADAELEFTLPADGTTVNEPVTEISVGFTEPVTLVGNGFEVLTPAGTVLEPFPVTDDDMIFRLPIDPPLAGGPVGVRYVVTDAEGNTIEGSFVFDAAAPLPTDPPTTPALGPPPTSVTSTSAATPTPASTASSVATDTATGSPDPNVIDPDGDDSDSTTIIGGAIAVAVVAALFLLVRSRRHGG